MKPGYTKKVNLTVGLAFLMGPIIFASVFLIPGIATQLWLLVLLILLAQILFITGCCLYAKGKGYSSALGLLGLLYIPGLLILAFFPDKHKGEDTDSGCLLTLLFLVLVLVLIFGPVFFYVSKAIKSRNGQLHNGQQSDKLKDSLLRLNVTLLESSLADLGTRMKAMDALVKEGNPGLEKLREVNQQLKNKPSHSSDDDILIRRIDESLAANGQASTDTRAIFKAPNGLRTVRITLHRTSHVSDQTLQQEEVRTIDFEKNRQRTETTTSMKIGNTETKTTQSQLFDGSRLYTITQPNQAIYADFHGDRPVWEYSSINESDFKGEESILGKTTRKYQPPERTVWLWDGIVLKEQINLPNDQSSAEATSIEENVPVADNLFVPSPGVKIVSTDELVRQVKGAQQESSTSNQKLNELRKDLAAAHAKGIDFPFKTIKITYRTKTEYFGKYKGVVLGEVIDYMDVSGDKPKTRTETRTWRPGGQKPSVPFVFSMSDGIKQYTINSLRPNVASTFELPGPLPPLVELDVERFKLPIGKETVAGHLCSVYQDNGAKRWVWNRLILKEDRQTPRGDRHSEKEAVDVQENIPLSSDLFTLPPDIKLIPIGELQTHHLRKRQKK